MIRSLVTFRIPLHLMGSVKRVWQQSGQVSVGYHRWPLNRRKLPWPPPPHGISSVPLIQEGAASCGQGIEV